MMRRTTLTLAAAAALVLLPGPRTCGQTLGSGTLANLALPRGGKIAHYSSYDRKGGNADLRKVPPGETLTLVDHQGAGIVRRWWITIAPFNHKEIQRQGILRCYWDGEEDPSVEVPVADFFGMGFGEYKDFISLPLNMTSGGYNCYWPMPFHRSARITFENRSKVTVDSFYFNLSIETQPKLPEEMLYFHAQFRRTKPTVRGQPVVLLEATGMGHYVGTLLSMQPLKGRSLGYLEGDEVVHVDGEQLPSIIGTGTEDYFSSGWYYRSGTYAAPYHGVTLKDNRLGRINTYRWHVEDPVPFTQSLRFLMEHGGTNDRPYVDYSSVAYWYQTHPKPRFPPLPEDLLPIEPEPTPKIAGIIEGESLRPSAWATAGEVSVQEMYDHEGEWSGMEQLWWRPGKPGEKLTVTLNAPDREEYELVGHFTRAGDYGNFKVAVNGQALAMAFEGYADRVRPSGPVSFGRVALNAGANEVVLEVTGKDDRSKNHFVGIDGFVLKP